MRLIVFLFAAVSLGGFAAIAFAFIAMAVREFIKGDTR